MTRSSTILCDLDHLHDSLVWKKGSLLGRGDCGEVHLYNHFNRKLIIAVKEVAAYSVSSQSSASNKTNELKNEISLLEKLSHDRIVTYLASCFDNENKILSVCLEYVAGGSLNTLLQNKGPLTHTIAIKYTQQLLEGVIYLHKHRIIHRDIKGENILITQLNNIKLADFGLSKQLETLSSTCDENYDMFLESRAIMWTAPEIICKQNYGLSVDIWSIGCTIVEMLTTHPPWHYLKNSIIIDKIKNKEYPAYELPESGSVVENILHQCFQLDPEKRPSAENMHQTVLFLNGMEYSTSPPASLSNSSVINRPTPVSDDLRYKCIVCHCLIIDPYQTECGHRGCKSCFQNLIEQAGGNPVKCTVGEPDCENITLTFPDKSFAKELSKIIVYCSNKNFGCNQTLKYGDVKAHLENCAAKLSDCPHGCGVAVVFSKLADHENLCKKLVAICEDCQMTVKINEMETHQKNDCPESLISCQYQCGADKFPRKEISEHYAECDMIEKPCDFQPLGCPFVGNNKARKVHLVNDNHHHRLIVEHIIDLRKRVDTLENKDETRSEGVDASASYGDELQYAASEIKHLQNKVTQSERAENSDNVGIPNESTRDEIQKFKSEFDKYILKMNKLEKAVALQFEKLLEIEDNEMLSSRSSLDSIEKKTLRELESLIKSLGNRITALETSPASDGTGKIRQAENEITLHSVRLAEMDLRIQCLESASYDGRLMWKISEYKKRKADAVSNKVASIYSQPFYSNRFGYKMCARVYLNGDGMGKNTHLSLFFVVMRGEYDQLLTWPFKQKVTFQLIDQETNSKHISDSFRPDPASNSFKRPTTDMNIASGCPLFVSQQTVEMPMYYNSKDDCIFLKIIVDTSGLES